MSSKHHHRDENSTTNQSRLDGFAPKESGELPDIDPKRPTGKQCHLRPVLENATKDCPWDEIYRRWLKRIVEEGDIDA